MSQNTMLHQEKITAIFSMLQKVISFKILDGHFQNRQGLFL